MSEKSAAMSDSEIERIAWTVSAKAIEGHADNCRAIDRIDSVVKSADGDRKMLTEIHGAILGTPMNPSGLAGRVGRLEDHQKWLWMMLMAVPVLGGLVVGIIKLFQ